MAELAARAHQDQPLVDVFADIVWSDDDAVAALGVQHPQNDRSAANQCAPDRLAAEIGERIEGGRGPDLVARHVDDDLGHSRACCRCVPARLDSAVRRHRRCWAAWMKKVKKRNRRLRRAGSYAEAAALVEAVADSYADEALIEPSKAAKRTLLIAESACRGIVQALRRCI